MRLLTAFIFLITAGVVQAAPVVPNEAQMPGTQPEEIGEFDLAEQCDFCHGGYNTATPATHGTRTTASAATTRN